MEDNLLPMLAGFGLSGALLARSAFARQRLRKQLTGLDEAFLAYASTHHLTLIPASPGWDPRTPGDGSPPALRGELSELPVELHVELHGTRIRTRAEAALASVAEGFVLIIHPRGALARLRARVKKQLAEARTGNKVFDRRYALLSNDADQARSIVDRRLAQVVGNFPRTLGQISVNNNRFTLEWEGAEREPSVLDAALHLVWTGCRRRA